MLFLGEVEVGLWRGLCEDEVESRAMASWTDRRRSPAWGRGLVFRAGSSGAVASGRAVPVGGSSGGGRKAAVALGDAGWSSTLTSTSASVRVQPKVNLPWEQPGAPGRFSKMGQV